MAIALDGTPIRTLAGGGGQTAVVCSAVAMTINDIMVIMTTSSNQASSVSGSVNGAYAKLGDINGSAGEWSSIWWKLSGSTGTENITANQASGSYIEGTGFGVSGANTSTPWDTLTGSSFVTNATFHTTGPAITTTGSVPEMVLGVGADGAGGGPYGADTSWTALTLTKTNGLAEYRIQPSTGTFTFNSTNRFFSGGIGAALLEAGGGGATASYGNMSMMGVGHHKGLGWTPLLDRRSRVFRRPNRSLWTPSREIIRPAYIFKKAA